MALCCCAKVSLCSVTMSCRYVLSLCSVAMVCRYVLLLCSFDLLIQKYDNRYKNGIDVLVSLRRIDQYIIRSARRYGC
jgi:hypothetical protein